MRAVVLVGVFALAAVVPAASGQVPIAEPYPGCAARPEDCDPVAANGGQVKRGDEPVRLILYGHFQDLLQRAPINAQPPDPEHEPDLNRGFLTPTLYTADRNLPCCQFRSNDFVMYSSPGLIDYRPDGAWRVHMTPGLAGPLRIVSPEITGYWYLSPGHGGVRAGDVGSGGAPGVVPAVGVQMKVNMGRFTSDDESQLIASGDTGLALGTDASSSRTGVVMVSLPSEDPVFEFRVPMTVHRDELPSRWDDTVSDRDHGFIVTVTTYQYSSDEVELLQPGWRVRTGYKNPPRIVLDIEEPLRSHAMSVTSAPRGARVEWGFTPALGAYDVDSDSVAIQVEGPSAIEPARVNIRWSVDCDGQFKPVRAIWHVPLDEAADGTYVVTGRVMNHQRTYELTQAATFLLQGGRLILPPVSVIEGNAVGIPGVGALFGVLAALGAVALRGRG